MEKRFSESSAAGRRARWLRQLPEGRAEARCILEASLAASPDDRTLHRESRTWWLSEPEDPATRDRATQELRLASNVLGEDPSASIVLALLRALSKVRRQRQGRRGRLLLGRRHGRLRRHANPRPGRGGAVLRTGAGERKRRRDPGAAAAHVRRQRRLREQTWPPYEAALKAAGKRFEAFKYPGTQHGFDNDTTPRFDAAAAGEAWRRTIAFFNRDLAHLSASAR